MRARTISTERLMEIKKKIDSGVYTIQEAARAYGVPASTLYRNLREQYGRIRTVFTPPEPDAVLSVKLYLEANGISPSEMTSHQKMVAMDGICDRFHNDALCMAFDVAPICYAQHRKNLAKGPNSYKRREVEIEKAVDMVLAMYGITNVTPTTPVPAPYRICRILKKGGFITSPQLVARVLAMKTSGN